MYVSRKIDWFEFTLPPDFTVREAFPAFQFKYVGVGSHGYAARFEDARTGATCQSFGATDAMGNHYCFGGQALSETQRIYGCGFRELAARVLRSNGNVSRVDLAIDCREGKLTPTDYYNAIKQGQIRAKGRSFRFIEGKSQGRQGQTLYIGSPQSDKMLRIYDKAAEQRTVDSKAWLRLEMQCRRLVARAAFGSCVQNGIDETIRGHIKEAVNWNNAEFAEAIDGDVVEPEQLGRKITNRQNWLMGQVASALAKEIDFDPDFWEQFQQAVWAHVQQLPDVTEIDTSDNWD